MVHIRRITQGFFLILFLWLCLVASPGDAFHQLGAWPVTWLLQLDPLVGLSTTLARGSLEPGLLWGLLTIAMTLLLGRVFCGWICPLGALNQLVSWLSWLGRDPHELREANQPRGAEGVGLWVLLLQLGTAGGAALAAGGAWLRGHPLLALLAVLGLVGLLEALIRRGQRARRLGRRGVVVAALGLLIVATLPGARALLQASQVFGLLDPLPLLNRSVHTVLLPLADRGVHVLWPFPRQHLLAPITALVLAAVLLANLWRPRAFCRMACPLGALLGVIGRVAPWRIAKSTPSCSDCGLCEVVCTSGAQPSGTFRQSSCTLCMSCVGSCPEGLLSLSTQRSAAGERSEPDLSRRAATAALATGVIAVPGLRLGGILGDHTSPKLIRPPGAVNELDFLSRCVACAECMRACPTNVLQPAGLLGGIETAFTPTLDMRIGTSGCQPTCTACGEVCPTGAIRPLSVDQKLGQGSFAGHGPVRIGTATVDRDRCLPWSYGRACAVCQEVCPVSPKAVQLEQVVALRPDGTSIALSRPRVDPLTCIGCGVCEHECPVPNQAAIRVTNAGEVRAPTRPLVLGS